MPSLFGLFGRDDRRRPTRARAYTPGGAAPRRYEMPRPEPRRAMDLPPRAERRRPPVEVNWRRRAMLALGGLGVVAVLAGGTWLYRSPTFRVRVIDVEGVQVADPQAVAKAAGLSGASLFTVDLARAEREVAKLPAVKAAKVTRNWPHGARIDVTEHQAWGYWQAGPQRLVIDEAGRILEQSRPPAADAPTIVELAAAAPDAKGVSTDPDTVQLVNRLRTDGTFDRLKVKPTSFVFRRDRGLTVIVAEGPAAVLGDSSNYDFKVRTWQALLEQVRAGQVPAMQAAQVAGQSAPKPGQSAPLASEVDLRFGRNVVLR